MGFLTNNINETGKAILEIQAAVLENINSITFSIIQLETQLNNMKSNNDFNEVDINELIDLILNLKKEISDIK